MTSVPGVTISNIRRTNRRFHILKTISYHITSIIKQTNLSVKCYLEYNYNNFQIQRIIEGYQCLQIQTTEDCFHYSSTEL